MNNLVKGTIFRAKLPVFEGDFRNAKFSHDVIVKGKIVSESYNSKGQYTYTFEVLESTDVNNFTPGNKYRKMEHNLYPHLLSLEQPENYVELAREKMLRRYSINGSTKSPKEIFINQCVALGISLEDATRMANKRFD